MAINLKGRHLTSILDLNYEETIEVLETTKTLKLERYRGVAHHILPGRTLAMIFEKSSTRTRVSFEVGIQQLGGNGLYLSSKDLQLGRGETVADTARVISRYVDCIMARVFEHKTILDLARYSSVPVINGLSDYEHPCQALGDIFTLWEKFGTLKGLNLSYIGDGNNVCNSLMFVSALLGINFHVASPKGYFPRFDIINTAKEMAKKTGSTITVEEDVISAVKNADAIYTDVWVSMGDEAEKEIRLKTLQPYQLNSQLLKHAKEDYITLHCLPAHRGEEITDEVMDDPLHSKVFDQAENRLHVQKAVMALLMR